MAELKLDDITEMQIFNNWYALVIYLIILVPYNLADSSLKTPS